MQTLHLRPANGLQVRKEDGTCMPDKGCEVPNDQYYRRRLIDGDLVIVDAVKAAKPAKGDK